MDHLFNPYLRDLSGSRASTVSPNATDLGSGKASDCRADGPEVVAIDMEALLPYSPTMPLAIRQRLRGAPSEVVRDEGDAKALLEDALQETGDYAAARVLLLRKYEIELSIVQPLFAQCEIPERRSPLGNIKFSRVGPLFHFFPHEDPILSQFRVPRSRLPLAILKETCQRLEDAERQYGPLDAHSTEGARTQYLETILCGIVPVFEGRVRNSPEQSVEGRVAAEGRIVNVFQAYGAVCLIIDFRKNWIGGGGAPKRNSIARLLAECDRWDYINSCSNLWTPILYILSNGHAFEYFAYDSSEQRIFSSKLQGGLAPRAPFSDGEDNYLFLRSAKRVVETMFDFLLTGYVNCLQAAVGRVEKQPPQLTGGVRESQSQWRYSRTQWKLALRDAKKALAHARSAYVIAVDPNRTAEAEAQSVHAIELLKSSIRTSPGGSQQVSFMPAWEDSAMSASD